MHYVPKNFTWKCLSHRETTVYKYFNCEHDEMKIFIRYKPQWQNRRTNILYLRTHFYQIEKLKVVYMFDDPADMD